MATLTSIQIGAPTRYEPVEGDTSQKPWTTAFFKRPVNGPVTITKTGPENDSVAETRVHGGPDKAVCCYPSGHFAYWRDRLDEPGLGPAAFGENFTLDGLDEQTVCLGDHWRIGTATFEVSQPRQPCWKLARRWKRKELTLWVQQTGYTGWYIRVLEEGVVSPGDPVTIINNSLPDWTIARANQVMYDLKDDRDATESLIAVSPLAESWKRQLRKRL